MLTSLNKVGPKKLFLDSTIAIVFFALSFYVAYSGMTEYRKTGGQYIQFYQSNFAPAVTLACGKGFATYSIAANSGQEKLKPLYDFLNLKRDRLDCSELPDLPVNNNPPQKIWFYLIHATAMLWKITGVSWPAVDILVGILYAISITACYGLFRLGMGRLIAIPSTLLLCGSSLQLSYLPWLRDYGKAPFLLVVLFLLGLLVTTPFKKTSLFIMTALCGIIIGVGYGFRSDMLITIPPVILTILFFIPGKTFANFPKKIASLGIFLTTFCVVAFPILTSNLNSGSCTFDNIIEGLMPQFSSTLMVNLSPIYEIGHQYSDLLAYAIIGTHADHFLGLNLDQSFSSIYETHCTYCSPAYDSAGRSLFNHLVNFFPADFLIRGYAAANQVLNLGFISQHHIVLPPPTHFVTSIYQQSRPYLALFQNLGISLSLLATFLIGIFNLRIAFFLLLGVVYFSFYPMVQFHPRHFFQLEFISLWVLGFLIYQSFRIFQAKKLIKHLQGHLLSRCFYSGTLIISVVFMGLLLLNISRQLQMKNIKNLVTTYENSEKSLLTKTVKDTDNNNSLVTVNLWDWDKDKISKEFTTAKMLLIEFDGKTCSNNNVDLTIEYDFIGADAGYHFNKKDSVPISPGEKTIVYTPIFASKYFRFKGINVPKNQTECVGNLYQVTGKIDNHPLWLFLKLPPNWQEQSLYQTLK